jgi:hypothetical protein
MKVISTSVTVNPNTVEYQIYQIIGQTSVFMPGMKEVTGKIDIEFDSVYEASKFVKKPEVPITSFNNNSDWYILKDATVTGYNMSTKSDGTLECSVDLMASDISYQTYKDVKFKGRKKKIKVNYKDYSIIKETYGNPEDMTLKEFKDKVMVENI